MICVLVEEELDGQAEGEKLLNWEIVQKKMPWGIFLLFGKNIYRRVKLVFSCNVCWLVSFI